MEHDQHHLVPIGSSCRYGTKGIAAVRRDSLDRCSGSVSRKVTRKMLEVFGYRTVLAADGAEALALYQRHRGEIAAVLTDMMMPVLDGAATIRALREVDPDVRVIAVTGLSEAADKTPDAVRAAGTRRLPKPYTTEELLRALDDLLRQG